MNLYRSLLISTFLIIFVLKNTLQQQACPEGGYFVENIHSGIIQLHYDDLNEGSINKNYFEQIDTGTINKESRMTIAFSIVGFEGSGRQQYYALMLDRYTLQNQNTRLSITMDFQYPNSNMLSIWTQIRLSYLIVPENLQKNGYSYVWAFTRELSLKSSVESGIVEGDLFNHPNDKNLCGYDGRYWHTDGCMQFEAIAVYHCYISGWKFNPMGYIGIREFAFSVQLLNKQSQVSKDQKQQALDVIFNKANEAGPRIKIDNFDGQMQKIKVAIIMSIIQTNSATYPIGTFTITYSGIYFFNQTWYKGQQIIKNEPSSNSYHYVLPGIKYYIFGISKFIARKGLPRPVSIRLSSQIQTQNSIKIDHNFNLPMKELIFSADFYYKRINRICNTQNGINMVEKNRISEVKFQNYPSNDTTLLIRSVSHGDMHQTNNQSAIEYLYYPNAQIQQTAWVTYTFSNIKIGGSYIFYLSINQIANDGFADYTGYNFAVYANQHQIYRTLMIGSPNNDKIDGIQKALNINNNSIQVKIYTRIFRQQQKNVNFRVNLLVKQIIKVFNPLTQCCNSVCPFQTGINITSIPIQCIICDNKKGFFFNQKHNACLCRKGLYYIKDTVFPKCQLCHAGLCDMCQPQQPKKCIQCIFGALLDPYYRSCKCLPEFIQVENECFLNSKLTDVCRKYGYCDINFFTGIVFRPPALQCSEGTFDNGEGSCSSCNPECLTCSNITSCLTCDQNYHRVLQNSICVCKQGYFAFQHQNKTKVCLKCAPQCQSCQFNPQSCTQCDTSIFMQKSPTLKSFFTCECIPGYYPDGRGNCIESNCNADQHCATCEQKLCTSCTKSSNRILQLPEHICVCREGFFQNTIAECERCKSGCARCISPNVCLTCVISATNNNNGLCSCPNGTYFHINMETNIGFCRKCLAECETCSDQRSCVTCPSTYHLSQQKKCICTSGTFLEIQTGLCTDCRQGCAECNSLSECKKCKSFFRLQQSICVYNCRMGFYTTQTACFKCSQGCARCQNSLTCQQCSKGYILYQSRCHKQCPEGTIKAKDKNNCLPCNSPCQTCLYHPSQCVSCQNGKGYLQIIGDQMKCLNECPLGMYPQNGACKICDLNCLSCLGNKQNCIQCPVNRFLYKGKCHKQCPGVQYENTCMNFCPNGYFRLEDKKCWPCSEKCLTCEGDRQRCTSCRTNLVLKDNQCIQHCNQNQFLIEGKCNKCSSICKTCNGSALNCTSCFDHSLLNEGKCQNKCLQNQFFSTSSIKCLDCQFGCRRCLLSSLCITCSLNYTLNAGRCENNCNYPCENCLLRNQCVKCVTGFYLIESQMECIQFCPKGMRAQDGICKCGYGFYFNRTCHIVCPYQTLTNISSKTCQLCKIQNCAECLETDICLRCQTNFHLSKDQSQCLRQDFEMEDSYCPIGLMLTNNKCTKICPQQNFNTISTIENGSICIYGPYQTESLTQGVNFQRFNLKECPQHYFFDNGLCKVKCRAGYYPSLKTQSCQKCKQNCLICNNQKSCEICEKGYSLIQKRCVWAKCAGSRRFFNGICVEECPEGSYFDGQACQQICLHNHYLFEGLCYSQCPHNHPYKVDYGCFHTCPTGYTARGKTCIET